MARALAALRVDVIEAGFAASSPSDVRRSWRLRAASTGRSSARLPARPAATYRVGDAACSGARASASTSSSGPARSTAKPSCTWTARRCWRRSGTASPYARELPTTSNSPPRTRSAPSATSGRDAVGRGRRGRDDAERAGHGRLYDARRDLRPVPLPRWSRRSARRRDLLDPLPRRSRHGGRQFAGGDTRRRAAGRMRRERHWRTRGKLRARGRRHGA